MIKRFLDVVTSFCGLVILSPLFVVAAVLVKLDSKGGAFFKQLRIGNEFRPFEILKFRTMVLDAPKLGAGITVGEDPRITRIGRFLRMTKLDELPQLINVLKGDMSFVGPRPEIAKYVELFRDDYQEILRVRPGITDLASIKFRDEAALLGAADDPERQYIERILPEKIRLAKEYVRKQSSWLDLKIVALTAWALLADRLPTRFQRPDEPQMSVESTHTTTRKANEQ